VPGVRRQKTTAGYIGPPVDIFTGGPVAVAVGDGGGFGGGGGPSRPSRGCQPTYTVSLMSVVKTIESKRSGSSWTAGAFTVAAAHALPTKSLPISHSAATLHAHRGHHSTLCMHRWRRWDYGEINKQTHPQQKKESTTFRCGEDAVSHPCEGPSTRCASIACRPIGAAGGLAVRAVGGRRGAGRAGRRPSPDVLAKTGTVKGQIMGSGRCRVMDDEAVTRGR